MIIEFSSIRWITICLHPWISCSLCCLACFHGQTNTLTGSLTTICQLFTVSVLISWFE